MKEKKGYAGKNYFWLATLIESLEHIYPKKKTLNCYGELTKKLAENLNEEEQYYFEKLVHYYTLINQPQAKKEIESTYEDVQNAWLFIQEQKGSFKQIEVEFIEKIREYFGEEEFSLVQIACRTRLSISSVKRRIYPLYENGILSRRQEKTRAYYQLKPQESLPKKEAAKQSSFEVAFEEWEDYTGFVEL